MVNRLLQPQEIEVFYVIPALRREIATCMKSGGKSQKDIAKLLGVTEPAISQYMTSKRAALLKFNDNLKAEVMTAAKRITGEISLLREMQRLIQLIRRERIVCQVHESLSSVPKGCNVCFETNETIQIKGPV